MNIIILTSYSQSLSSVEVISKDIAKLYIELQSQSLKVTVYDINDKNFSVSNFATKEVNLFISAHPGVIRSPSFIKVAESMKKEDKLIVHVYGDFVRQATYFNEVEKYLINKQVLFLPPSKTYGNLLKKLIKNKDSIKPTPFPVEFENFKLNKSLKKNYGITDEIVLVYGGRISRQKNIDLLLEWFSSLTPATNYKLFIIGKFDDFEVGNVGNNFKLGELYQRLQKYNSSSVVFIDHLSHEELFSFYQMADYFVSFSTYHDEDFGRAPIEAILCGTPCLLSDWGGYRDLIEEFPSYVEALRTSLSSEGLNLSPGPDLKLRHKKVLKEIDKFKSKYSKEAFHFSLRKLLNIDFPVYCGVTELMSSLIAQDRSFFYEKNGELKQENYKKLYQGFGTEI